MTVSKHVNTCRNTSRWWPGLSDNLHGAWAWAHSLQTQAPRARPYMCTPFIAVPILLSLCFTPTLFWVQLDLISPAPGLIRSHESHPAATTDTVRPDNVHCAHTHVALPGKNTGSDPFPSTCDHGSLSHELHSA